jgi:N-acetylglucosaminyldiphosphoundecaprenol N-acetyl-beta-D-mannosaminyltransferase
MPINVSTTHFVGVDFTDLAKAEVIARIAADSKLPQFTTVITPNVDHIVRLDQTAGTTIGARYAAAIDDADLCLCDSRILARLARLRGVKLAVVPGSDLTAAIFADHLQPGDRIAIIGGQETTLAELAPITPGVEIIQHIPPMGMLHDDAAMDEAARFIRDSNSRFIFVAVGNPQGEILLRRAREVGAKSGVALSIGASIEFLTGRQTRAPRLLQRLGFEWAYRLLSEPKRLWRRYLVDGPRIFAIVMRRGDR